MMDTKYNSPLVNHNSLVHVAYGLWSQDSGQSINYTDGDAAENFLLEILQTAADRSATSPELEAAVYDWVTEYHLSGSRANIYRFLILDGVNEALELGAGCGAVTRYLGEQGMRLDAVEGNRRRAEICRLRCNDLENVRIIHANFNRLELPKKTYDAVFLNGVLEYAGRFMPGGEDDRNALLEIVSRSFASLKDDGLLCIAIENRNGLKYWLGAREDHFGRKYVGLYGYPEEIGIRTYDRQEWAAILSELGDGYRYRFIYPFPDYKMAKAILSERYITRQKYAYSNLYRMPSHDNAEPIRSELHEFLLWEDLHATGQLADYANSFFIVLSKDEQRLAAACPHDFMHFSGTGRKPRYRIITSKKEGRDVVEKMRMQDVAGEPEADLTHNLDDAPYLDGPLLVTRWIHALLHSDGAHFEECIVSYYRFLKQYWTDTADVDDAFDLLPFNIVVDTEGNYQQIDREWRIHREFTPEFVLFRALLWFPETNELLLGSILEKHWIETVRDFIAYGFRLVSLSLDESLDEFVALEEAIQAQVAMQVRSHPVRRLLQENLRRSATDPLSESLFVQLYWAGEKDEWSESRSVEENVRMGADSQTVTLRLPPTAKGAIKLRLDPANRAGFVHLHSLKVVDRAAGLLWDLDSSEKIMAASKMEDFHYCKNGLGEVFIATSEDPHLVFSLPDNVRRSIEESGVFVEVTMDWPKSAEYLIVMDSLGRKVIQHKLDKIRFNEELKEKNDQVRAKDIHIRDLEAELTAMKQTRIWRYKEWVREKIYFRLLDSKVLVKKSIETLRKEGVRQFAIKVKKVVKRIPDAEIIGLTKSDYTQWVERNQLGEQDIAERKAQINAFTLKPLISIVVPVYNVAEEWLTKMIESVRGQLYENWELCLCDDCSPSPHVRKVLQQYAGRDKRIKVLFSDVNGGIAVTSNKALSLATGNYAGLLDHDDELSIDALYEVVRVINRYPEAELIYSDEDKLDMQGNRVDPFFKPDFSPELIYSQNYICHFTVIKKTILDEIGGFREGFDGSQDHDLILRAAEKARRIEHIPRILYHWRKIPGSTAAVYDSKSYAWEAGRKAIEESLVRTGVKGTVSFGKFQGTYRVQREIIGNPLVSIVIPFKDKAELLNKCISSILEKSTYSNYEILGVSNNSAEEKTRQAMQELCSRDARVRFEEYNVPFNFADICNYGVEKARGEYVVLLNNDIEIVTPGWIESMLELAQCREIGAVGGKLVYPDQRIQHAGIVMGMAGVAGHPHHFFHKEDVGYYARPHVIHDVSAVTGACMMVSRDLYLSVGGMDNEHFAVAYNDVDFCLKLLHKGLRNVYTPFAEMIHYESATRGYEDTPEKMARLRKEADFLTGKWPEYVGQEDPYYSPHLSLKGENFAIRL